MLSVLLHAVYTGVKLLGEGRIGWAETHLKGSWHQAGFSLLHVLTCGGELSAVIAASGLVWFCLFHQRQYFFVFFLLHTPASVGPCGVGFFLPETGIQNQRFCWGTIRVPLILLFCL